MFGLAILIIVDYIVGFIMSLYWLTKRDMRTERPHEHSPRVPHYVRHRFNRPRVRDPNARLSRSDRWFLRRKPEEFRVSRSRKYGGVPPKSRTALEETCRLFSKGLRRTFCGHVADHLFYQEVCGEAAISPKPVLKNLQMFLLFIILSSFELGLYCPFTAKRLFWDTMIMCLKVMDLLPYHPPLCRAAFELGLYYPFTAKRLF